MFYSIPIQPILIVNELYTVKRNNVWSCTDDRNILIFIKDGCCYFTIDSKKTFVNKGSFILIPANTAYTREHYNSTYCEMMYFHFLTSSPLKALGQAEAFKVFNKQIYNEDKDTLSASKTHSDIGNSICLSENIDLSGQYDYILKLISRIISGYQNSLHYNIMRRSLRFTDMLLFLGTKCIKDMTVSVPSALESDSIQLPIPLQKAIFYIRQNYKNQITIDELCATASVSPQHLIRLFKKHLDTTPIRYINHQRILNSLDLLRTTNMSIKEISNELGFENQNYFNRLFKKQIGITPSEKRENIRNYEKEHPIEAE